jgi:hypothetical protein
MKQQILPKRWYQTTRYHTAEDHKPDIAVRTADFTKNNWVRIYLENGGSKILRNLGTHQQTKYRYLDAAMRTSDVKRLHGF